MIDTPCYAMASTSATASLQRRTLGVFTTNVVVLGIGYVASIMLARFLGADGRGLVAVILTGDGGARRASAASARSDAATYYASRRARRRPYVLGNGLAHAASCSSSRWRSPTSRWASCSGTSLRTTTSGSGCSRRLLVPSYYLDELVSSLLSAEGAFGLRNRLNVTARITTTVATLAIVGWLGWGVAGALIASMPALLVPAIGGLRAGRAQRDRVLAHRARGVAALRRARPGRLDAATS